MDETGREPGGEGRAGRRGNLSWDVKNKNKNNSNEELKRLLHGYGKALADNLTLVPGICDWQLTAICNSSSNPSDVQ